MTSDRDLFVSGLSSFITLVNEPNIKVLKRYFKTVFKRFYSQKSNEDPKIFPVESRPIQLCLYEIRKLRAKTFHIAFNIIRKELLENTPEIIATKGFVRQTGGYLNVVIAIYFSEEVRFSSEKFNSLYDKLIAKDLLLKKVKFYELGVHFLRALEVLNGMKASYEFGNWPATAENQTKNDKIGMKSPDFFEKIMTRVESLIDEKIEKKLGGARVPEKTPFSSRKKDATVLEIFPVDDPKPPEMTSSKKPNFSSSKQKKPNLTTNWPSNLPQVSFDFWPSQVDNLEQVSFTPVKPNVGDR